MDKTTKKYTEVLGWHVSERSWER